MMRNKKKSNWNKTCQQMMKNEEEEERITINKCIGG